MKRRRASGRATEAELEILRVMWERGPSTVREVHEALSQNRNTGYTTVLKLMQIMFDKGLLGRDEAGRAHIYRPVQSADQAQRTLVTDLMDRAFGGSAQQLVMRALTARRATADELAEIRRLLDELEGNAA